MDYEPGTTVLRQTHIPLAIYHQYTISIWCVNQCYTSIIPFLYRIDLYAKWKLHSRRLWWLRWLWLRLHSRRIWWLRWLWLRWSWRCGSSWTKQRIRWRYLDTCKTPRCPNSCRPLLNDFKLPFRLWCDYQSFGKDRIVVVWRFVVLQCQRAISGQDFHVTGGEVVTPAQASLSAPQPAFLHILCHALAQS